MNKNNLISVYIPKGQEDLYAQAQQLAEMRGLSIGKLFLDLVTRELERENKTPHVATRVGGYVIRRGKMFLKGDGTWTTREDEAMNFAKEHLAYEALSVVEIVGSKSNG